MRNRAKCKLCNSIVESFMKNDYVTCSCGNISVNHGPALWVEASDWDNFVRIDDEGNEVTVRYEEKKKDHDCKVYIKEEAHKPTKIELISMIDDMVKSYENLPQHAMLAPVSHADQLSLLMLVSSLFKSI
jgi:hypothetical protein